MNSQILKKYKLPALPGVYFFRGENEAILYIGKATSLKDRVRSYYAKDLLNTRGPLLVQMLEKAKSITFEKTDSVLEALILETQLIKRHLPPFNTKEKDDKSYNYLVITKEDFPRVLLIRSKDLAESYSKEMRLYEIGPFPQGGTLKEALRIIRRIFPFRDKCLPAGNFDNKVLAGEPNSGRPCFNAQIGLCPGVCAGTIGKAEYKKHIKHLISFFEGKKKEVVRAYKKEMQDLAKKNEFEKAAEVRRRLFALEHIQDVSLIKRKNEYKNQLGHPMSKLSKLASFRIESYDIAHLSGKEMVGVMTVIENDAPNKNEYRKFKIRTIKDSNDPGAMREVLTRRFNHPEWPMPQIVVVDGNEVQKKVAEDVIRKSRLNIEVIAVVKDEKHRPRALIGGQKTVDKYKEAILLANAEAHRFAIAFHRLRRKKGFLPQSA